MAQFFNLILILLTVLSVIYLFYIWQAFPQEVISLMCSMFFHIKTAVANRTKALMEMNLPPLHLATLSMSLQAVSSQRPERTLLLWWQEHIISAPRWMFWQSQCTLMPNTGSQALIVAHPVTEDAGARSSTSCIGFNSLPCREKTLRQYLQGQTHQYVAGVCTHPDKTVELLRNIRDEQGAACRLMPGRMSFYLFHITRIKLPKRIEDNVLTNLFWRPRLYLYLALLRRIRVLCLCLMQALIFFPPLCFSFSLERRPISAPGSCPLRFSDVARAWTV